MKNIKSIIYAVLLLGQITLSGQITNFFSYPEFEISISPEAPRICPGQTINVTCNEDFISYQWDGVGFEFQAFGQSVELSEIGQYVLTVENQVNGIVCSDQITFYSLLDDWDNDGICDEDDCYPFNSLVYEGGPCDDNDLCTRNDSYDEDCNCLGVTIPNCQECSINTICDDGDPCTSNDKFDSECNCIGEYIPGCEECEINTFCDDNNACTENDSFNEDCLCKGTPITDCLECDLTTDCDDGNPCTINDKFDENCNCIGVPKDELAIQKQIVECNQNEIKLTAIGDFSIYYWFRDNEDLNEFDSEIIISSEGEYKVEVHSEDGCILTKNTIITADNLSPQVIISASENKICNADSPVTLSIDDNYISSAWYYENEIMSEFDGKHNIQITKEGTYKVEAIDIFNCHKTGIIVIESEFNKKVIIQPENPVYCGGDFEDLSIEITNELQTILWSTGATTNSITPTQTGDYSVTVTNTSGCISFDEVSYKNESETDIDKILLENGFLKERVIITGIETTLKNDVNNDDSRTGPIELNSSQSYIYQIERIELDQTGESIDLNKYCQTYINDYYCYDESSNGKLLDHFCSDEPEDINLDEFILFSSEEPNFSFYIEKAEIGEETFLYINSPIKENLSGTKDHENLFQHVFYSILCNKQKGENTFLDKPSLGVMTHRTNGTQTIPNQYEKNLNFIQPGSLLLPDINVAEVFSYNDLIDGNILSLFDPYKVLGNRGIVISNYIQGGTLLTEDLGNIEATPSSTVDFTIDGYKNKITYEGDFYEIRIKYDPNSISGNNTQTYEGDNCVDNEYLTITLSKDQYLSNFNDLFNHTDQLIEKVVNPDNSFGNEALKLIPACLFEPDEFCSLLQSKYQNLDKPLQTLNKVLSDENSSLSINFSEDLISCFDDNNLVDNYYNLSKETLKGDRVGLLENLTNHFYLANPQLDFLVPSIKEDLVHLIKLEKDNDAEGNNKTKLTYETEVLDGHLKYSNSWAIPTYPINIDSNDPPAYAYTYSLNQENQLNYFDSDKSTPEYEGYLVEIGKEYNYLSLEQKELYFDNQFNFAKVPGIYVLYALEKKKYQDSKDVIDNTIDLAAIAFSFIELGPIAPLVHASRLAKLRSALAAGEIITTGASIHLRNSEWCKDIDPKFCDQWKIYIQRAQVLLLAGQGSAALYSKYLKVRNRFDELATEPGNKQDQLTNAISDLDEKNAFVHMMGLELDILTKLKNTFSKIDDKYPLLIDDLYLAVEPNQMKLFELENAIKALDDVEAINPINGKKFFDDIIATKDLDGTIGKELANLTGGQVKAWEGLFNTGLRTDIPWLTRSSKWIDEGGNFVESGGKVWYRKGGGDIFEIKNQKILPNKKEHYHQGSGGIPIGEPANGYQVVKVGDDIKVKRVPDESPYQSSELNKLKDHPDAHVLERHGHDVTDDALNKRATEGIAPDGSTTQSGNPPQYSSKFESPDKIKDVLNNVGPGTPNWNPPASGNSYAFDYPISGSAPNSFGYGIPSGGGSPVSMNRVKVVYKKDGGVWKLLTMYPQP